MTELCELRPLEEVVVAIDPGWTGAVVVAEKFEGKRTPLDVKPCPKTVGGMVELMKTLDPSMAYIERVHSGMFSKVSNFRLGENYGNWCGVLSALGIPFKTITPQFWQKPYQPPRKKGRKRSKSFDIKRVVWKEMKKLYPKMLGKKYRPCESHTSDALGILTNAER